MSKILPNIDNIVGFLTAIVCAYLSHNITYDLKFNLFEGERLSFFVNLLILVLVIFIPGQIDFVSDRLIFWEIGDYLSSLISSIYLTLTIYFLQIFNLIFTNEFPNSFYEIIFYSVLSVIFFSLLKKYYYKIPNDESKV